MIIISINDFQTLVTNPTYLKIKTSFDRPKLLEAPDGRMIKIFYPRKKKISSNQFKPYALRFCQNSEKLTALGFIAPKIDEIKYCPELNIYILAYQKIPGENTRILTQQNSSVFLRDIAKFVARLHQQGVFFRGIHLENLLYHPAMHFVLLDIVDVKINKTALNIFVRYRNLKHLFKTEDDKEFWSKGNKLMFLTEYFTNSKISNFSKKILSKLLLL
jgi:tRNA A-37 threonylcarbamoyl transferase component Bud32